jgi:hypothetical protein
MTLGLNSKITFVPVNATKEKRVCGGINPFILNLCIRRM